MVGTTSASCKRTTGAEIVSRLLQTDTLDGQGKDSSLKLVSLYTDQKPEKDIGRLLAASHRFRVSDTIEDALTLGTGRLAVDGPQVCREPFLVRCQRRRLRSLRVRADSLRRWLPWRSRAQLMQPRSTRGRCERHNDAGQQQRSSTVRADRPNGASSILFVCCDTVSLGFRGGQPKQALRKRMLPLITRRTPAVSAVPNSARR